MLLTGLNLRESPFVVISEDLFTLFAIYLAQFHCLECFLLLNVTSRYIIRGIDSWRSIVVQLHYLLELTKAVAEVNFRSLLGQGVASLRGHFFGLRQLLVQISLVGLQKLHLVIVRVISDDLV